MKVLMLNGSPHPKGCTFTALSTVAAQLEKNGVETQMLQLGTKPIQCCIGCGKCNDTGHCVFNADHVNEAIDLLREAGARSTPKRRIDIKGAELWISASCHRTSRKKQERSS